MEIVGGLLLLIGATIFMMIKRTYQEIKWSYEEKHRDQN